MVPEFSQERANSVLLCFIQPILGNCYGLRFSHEPLSEPRGTHPQLMMMIAFTITFNTSLVYLIEGLCSSNPLEFEFSGFRQHRTDDLGINSASL